MDTSSPQAGQPGINQPAPQNPNVPQYQPPREPRSSAPIVAIIGLIIVAAIAALYFWGENIAGIYSDESGDSSGASSISASADAKLDAIERDLNSTDIENSDKELQDIDKEF